MKLASLVANVTTTIQLSVAGTSHFGVGLCRFQLQQTSTEAVAVRVELVVSELGDRSSIVSQFVWGNFAATELTKHLHIYLTKQLREAQLFLNSYKFLKQPRNSPHFMQPLRFISVLATARHLPIS
jgi:hypothetical protein